MCVVVRRRALIVVSHTHTHTLTHTRARAHTPGVGDAPAILRGGAGRGFTVLPGRDYGAWRKG